MGFSHHSGGVTCPRPRAQLKRSGGVTWGWPREIRSDFVQCPAWFLFIICMATWNVREKEICWTPWEGDGERNHRTISSRWCHGVASIMSYVWSPRGTTSNSLYILVFEPCFVPEDSWWWFTAKILRSSRLQRLHLKVYGEFVAEVALAQHRRMMEVWQEFPTTAFVRSHFVK